VNNLRLSVTVPFSLSIIVFHASRDRLSDATLKYAFTAVIPSLAMIPSISLIQKIIISMSNHLYVVKSSSIHGNGIFAAENMPRGTEVGVVSRDKNVTDDFGRWVNHSECMNNGFIEDVGDNTYFVTSRRVYEGEELTVNYWDTPEWMEKPLNFN
jgi:hypothetical protein